MLLRSIRFRRPIAALALLIAPLAACAEAPAPQMPAPPSLAPQTTGILWNRSGLPATLPLEVRSAAGRDYRLTLLHPSDRQAVFAAAIRGGAFFRVLVPPGRYLLQFEAGPEWLGREAGFGPGTPTEIFTLPQPLEFSVAGLDRRRGHIVDLTARDTGAQAATEALTLCAPEPQGRAGLPVPAAAPHLPEAAPGTFVRDLADQTRLTYAERQGYSDSGARAQTPHRRGLPAPAPLAPQFQVGSQAATCAE